MHTKNQYNLIPQFQPFQNALLIVQGSTFSCIRKSNTILEPVVLAISYCTGKEHFYNTWSPQFQPLQNALPIIEESTFVFLKKAAHPEPIVLAISKWLIFIVQGKYIFMHTKNRTSCARSFQLFQNALPIVLRKYINHTRTRTSLWRRWISYRR